jgi:prepilin-type N-terminal cleavage/methylation domain-containing protein
MSADRKKGFTLIEVVIAAVILTIGVSLALGGLVYLFRGSKQEAVQDELDLDVQAAMEKIKYHLRLSSLDEMFFYPENANRFAAVSFPLCRDDDGDGIVETDANGKVIWDQTVVYHVYPASPNQLRVTTFDPRMTNLSDSVRQAQLESVVAAGNGSTAVNSTNASTEVIFANLFDWSLSPQGSRFDAYSSVTGRVRDVSLGSTVLSNGTHTFKFSTVGRNDQSSGYKVGLDAMYVSPSYGKREAEAHDPVAESGASAVEQYMAGGSWSGNYHLLFPASDTGQWFKLEFENDRWEETNFRRTGYFADGTEVIFDKGLNPKDYVVRLEGDDYNWYASDQTGDASGASATNDMIRGMAVRVLMKGSELEYDGGRVYVRFRAGDGPDDALQIQKAYISEAASASVPTQDIDVATQEQLTFGGGSSAYLVSGGHGIWTDSLPFDIDKDETYTISYLVGSGEDKGTPWKWQEVKEPGAVSAYVITNSAVEADLLDATWSDKSNVNALDAVLGVRCLFTRHPTNGTYTSGIFDTGIETPGYSTMTWNSDEPSGTSLEMKIRTATNSIMSDAASWSNITAMASGGAINPGDDRYVQFRATMTPNDYGYFTPRLKDVTIAWTGEERVVDIGGIFTSGPDHGIVELEVDGRKLKRGIEIDLEIYKETHGYVGVKTNTSALAAEVRPRNTGK